MSPAQEPVPESFRLAELERENAKLRKINKVLMDRVERSMDFQGNAFSLFQTAIVLESKVRERTGALQTALAELEEANHALQRSREEEVRANQFLAEAIESINEGFVLCDSQDRLVLTNSQYRALLPGLDPWLKPETPFEELVRRAMRAGVIADLGRDPEDWLRRRMDSHRAPGEPFVIQFRVGQWMQVSERRTRDGGIVSLYTDITEIKRSERRRRERELAQKSILLQATLDNLSQGVCVFDGTNRLLAWNQRFIELLAVPAGLLWVGTSLRQFLVLDAMRAQFEVDEFGTLRQIVASGMAETAGALCFEYDSHEGRVLEIRHSPMPDGGFVATYTDITERKRSEEALRDSERRMRLVTDAMPALIAYVDASVTYCFTNKAYEDWFNRPRSEINGRPMREVLGGELYDMRAQYVEQALQGQASVFEMTLPVGEQGVQYALATYVPHIANDGQVLGFFALIQDITARRRADQQLREAKETLERRVLERTNELSLVNLNLEAAKAEAERANLSKTRFLAAASHDLLQPLNAARVFIAALSERRMAPRNRSLVGSALTALDSVDELLTALLDISRLDAGVLQTDCKAFPIETLLSVLVEEHSMQARARGVEVRRVVSSRIIYSDPRLLARILRNFVSNALRYTPQGRIMIGCRRWPRPDGAAGLLIGVWDTGLGIPEDKLEEIFEEFRRLETSAERSEKGMGLGLAIVRRIALMLDLPVVVRSTPGRGSVFAVVVPLAEAVALPATPAELPSSLPPRHPAHLGGVRVLVIENEPAIQMAMAALLQGWGCQVVCALSSSEACRSLREQGRPDVILADYHLDDGAVGLDAIADVQRCAHHLFPQQPAIPASVITANHSPDLQETVRRAGYHLLNKPVKPGRLRSLLTHMVQV